MELYALTLHVSPKVWGTASLLVLLAGLGWFLRMKSQNDADSIVDDLQGGKPEVSESQPHSPEATVILQKLKSDNPHEILRASNLLVARLTSSDLSYENAEYHLEELVDYKEALVERLPTVTDVLHLTALLNAFIDLESLLRDHDLISPSDWRIVSEGCERHRQLSGSPYSYFKVTLLEDGKSVIGMVGASHSSASEPKSL